MVKIQIKTLIFSLISESYLYSFTMAIITGDPRSLLIVSVTSSQVDSGLHK